MGAEEAPKQNLYKEKFKVGDKVLGYRSGKGKGDTQGERMEAGWTVMGVGEGITLVSPEGTKQVIAAEYQVYKWNTPLKVGITNFEKDGTRYLVASTRDDENISLRVVRLQPDPITRKSNEVWEETQTIRYFDLMKDPAWRMVPSETEVKRNELPDDSLFGSDSIQPDEGVETRAEMLSVETQTCVIPKSNMKPSEDALVSIADGIAVCDGVGGEINSANAAGIAVKIAAELIGSIKDAQTAASIITKIDEELVKQGQKGRLCTTATIGKFGRSREGHIEMIYANSGDSGIIVYRGGKAILLTRDQSPLLIGLPKEQALKEQYKFAEVENPDDLGEEDRKSWNRRHEISRVLGERGMANNGTFSTITPLVETGRFKLQEDDIVEFATDGLKDVLTISRRLEIVEKFRSGEITDLATALANEAYQENIRLKEEAQRTYNSRAYVSLTGVSPILETNEISDDYIERDINQVNKMLKGTRYKPDDIGVGIKIIKKK